jgi:hypothetical protein
MFSPLRDTESKDSSFLKKRSKRLLQIRQSLSGKSEAQIDKSFLLLFFKKEDFSFLGFGTPPC